MASSDHIKLDQIETNEEHIAQTAFDGLSKVDAAKYLEQYGYNELPEKAANPVLKFLSYF